MKIKITSEQELVNVAEEAIQIIANLRKFTTLWEETHGVELKNRKKCWEVIADKFISKLQMPELKRNEQIKIEVNEKDKTVL
jgi:hypothetical protein